MQLGTRWLAHTLPPQTLVHSVKEAIAVVESDLMKLSQDTSTWKWTLTYLENRPVVQLDDGTTIRLLHNGEISIELEQ
jgi:Ethanolamine utilization protein EutJ (predicted chaperonin)